MESVPRWVCNTADERVWLLRPVLGFATYSRGVITSYVQNVCAKSEAEAPWVRPVDWNAEPGETGLYPTTECDASVGDAVPRAANGRGFDLDGQPLNYGKSGKFDAGFLATGL